MASLFSGFGSSGGGAAADNNAPAEQTSASAREWEWQSISAEVFNVRCGPNYRRNKKKAQSAAALYEAVDVRMVTTVDAPLLQACPHIELPTHPSLPDRSEDPYPHVPRVLVVAWNLPTCSPPLMASSNTGAGICVYYVFQITTATWEALNDLDSAPPAVKLWERYCREAIDTRGKQNLDVKGRFKAITQVANLEETAIPSMMHGYNGKPVLIKKTGDLTRSEDGSCMEMNVNVHLWPIATRAGFYSLMDNFSTALLDSAFVIEGREDDELPETVLGCARVCFPHVDQAGPPLS